MKFLKARYKPKQILRHVGMVAAGLVIIVLYNGLAALVIHWLVGIHLGLDIFVDDLKDTQLAQVLINGLFLDGVFLLLVRHFWLRRKTAKFWRSMHTSLMVIAIAVFITGAILPSALFIKARQSNDKFACEQEITLQQAYNAAFPINTDTGVGTAFAIDDHGTLVTAYHVIEGAKTIGIGVYRIEHELKVIKVNKEYDVALLKYDRPTPDFLPLTSTFRVGQPVYEIGWPISADDAGPATVTKGIISRTVSSEDARESGDDIPDGLSFIQTDAATNPGNSGGPLVNACGAVGVVNSSYTTDEAEGSNLQSGLNYATSSKSVRHALNLK